MEIAAWEKKQKIKSFTISKPFSQDLNLLLKQLQQIQRDLTFLSRQPQTPINAHLQQELQKLDQNLYQHWYQQVYSQCWRHLKPGTDPGNNLEKNQQQLSATRATIKWLSISPKPSRQLKREIRKLQISEKKLAKNTSVLQEQFRFSKALKQIRTGLAAFAITKPFSNNLSDVRSQVNTFQKDLKDLRSRPPSPEVQQSYRTLEGRYQELHTHWIRLEQDNLISNLNSGHINPPFSPDYDQARAEYDIVCQDIHYLKENAKAPGSKELYQTIAAKQRQLYDHLTRLRESQSSPQD